MTFVESPCDLNPLPLTALTEPNPLKDIEEHTKMRLKALLDADIYDGFFTTLQLVNIGNGCALWSLPIPLTPVHASHKETLVHCMEIQNVHTASLISRGAVRPTKSLKIEVEPPPLDMEMLQPARKGTLWDNVQCLYQQTLTRLHIADTGLRSLRYVGMEEGIISLEIPAFHPYMPLILQPHTLLECWQKVQPHVQRLQIHRLLSPPSPELHVTVDTATPTDATLEVLFSKADYQRVIAQGHDPTLPQRVYIKDIQHIVARHYGLTRQELCAEERPQRIVIPRQLAMYLCKELIGRSLPDIALYFGGRDHTTVLHAVRKIEEILLTDENLARDVVFFTDMVRQKQRPLAELFA